MGEVAKKQEQPNEVAGMLAMIERAATNPDVDVEKMERLYKMYSDMAAQRARQAFNQGMMQAQSKMGRISADATNPQTKSRYASYHALDKALRPIYTEHGFSLSFDTGDAPQENYVRVLCHVSHEDGDTRTYHADMPADGKGAKGGDVMTKTHAAGSAMSYGMRYLLKLIFNVAVGEDGIGPPNEPLITEKQAANIQALIDEVGEEGKRALFDWLKIDSIDQIPAKYYKKVVAGLEARR